MPIETDIAREAFVFNVEVPVLTTQLKTPAEHTTELAIREFTSDLAPVATFTSGFGLPEFVNRIVTPEIG